VTITSRSPATAASTSSTTTWNVKHDDLELKYQPPTG